MDFFSLRENSPYSEVFWPVFPGIRPEYGEYSVNIQSECGKKADQKNAKYGHFSRSVFTYFFILIGSNCNKFRLFERER